MLLMSPGRSISDARGPGPAAAALAVSVSETPDAVRLRIEASGDIEPGSVEVRFAGRKAVVLARDAEGRAIRSQRVRLPALVVEEGASADYDAADALVMTLRKQAAAQAAVPPATRKQRLADGLAPRSAARLSTRNPAHSVNRSAAHSRAWEPRGLPCPGAEAARARRRRGRRLLDPRSRYPAKAAAATPVTDTSVHPRVAWPPTCSAAQVARAGPSSAPREDGVRHGARGGQMERTPQAPAGSRRAVPSRCPPWSTASTGAAALRLSRSLPPARSIPSPRPWSGTAHRSAWGAGSYGTP
jgi:hypothetical protein